MNTNWLLHYPAWDLDVFGGGFLIAVIATLHVYIAHFAVGGGLFIVLTEIKARREGSVAVLGYAKAHARFFLLLTMVFGAITGVGIWFTISVLHPSGTSVLIHEFVFGWATEWVFFLAEIVTLFVYYYTFDRMETRRHLVMGWLYFAFAWLSLFVVNGIIAYMLTPGDWIETRSFWDGFFNPTFWPSLFFRTFMALMLAGLFGYVTAVFHREDDTRRSLLRYCSWWVVLPLPLLLMSGWWYAMGLPDPQRAMVLGRSPEILPFLKAFLWISPVLVVAAVLMALRAPLPLKKGIAALLVVIGLAYMGSFEWIREAGRRPFVIHDHLYSNGIQKADLAKAQKEGLLKSARWASVREISDENRMTAGRELYRFTCAPCHSIGGPMNDIRPLTDKFTTFGMAAMLQGMAALSPYMPPFPGNRAEQEALAAWIVQGIHGKTDKTPGPPEVSPEPVAVPPFDPETDEYILLAWSSKGMHFMTDCDARFSLSAPGGDLYAQLIRRGKLPEHVMADVEIHYALEEGFRDPAARVDFWKHAQALTGKDLPPGTGVDGNGVSGTMAWDDSLMAYAAKGVPAVPYPAGGGFMPYPLVTVEARDPESGEVLAAARTPLPVSTEMACRHCHGGDWRVADTAGIAPATAEDVLTLHDRMSGTALSGGDPEACGDCHAPDDPDRLNLSAAVHGFHAPLMAGRGDRACGACHPASPETFTSGFRGIHSRLFMDCTHCHGVMADHALSLLSWEKEKGKRSAGALMAHLRPRGTGDLSGIMPREPWVNEPDCLHCHVDFGPPDIMIAPLDRRTESKADLFRFRSDNAGIQCAACHGSPHALYPAANRQGSDSLQPIQYQGNALPIGADKNCRVCHTVDMEAELHHPNSLAMFRNTP